MPLSAEGMSPGVIGGLFNQGGLQRQSRRRGDSGFWSKNSASDLEGANHRDFPIKFRSPRFMRWIPPVVSGSEITSAAQASPTAALSYQRDKRQALPMKTVGFCFLLIGSSAGGSGTGEKNALPQAIPGGNVRYANE